MKTSHPTPVVSKSEERRREELASPVYRYHCEACSGVAIRSRKPMPFVTLRCAACGSDTGYKAENWIEEK